MFNISAMSSTGYEIAPAGEHVARCVKLIDLGTQSGKFNGRITRARKLMVYWELLGAHRRADGAPFVASKIYTVSMHPKATLRQDVEWWNGAPLSSAEVASFNADWMLDRYCRVTVTHAEANGNVRAGIERLAPLPDDASKPDAVNDIVTFSLADPDLDVFETLSPGVQRMIEASPEWQKFAAKGGSIRDARHQMVQFAQI
ncbi:phage replication initiation protein, NGO0469 family [Paraburkholderia sp. GAS348]|uniref:phage replication initiation protein, NGO0469 family n=1 Tax=Paraburkholderia sp. GAS348 TaxID=3035132 RepID=UPI003D242C74